MKPNFTPKKKRTRGGVAFWDHEYTHAEHLALSERESGDLAKFCRWLVRRNRTDILSPDGSAIDIGCGNGRNLIYLAREFGLPGIGLDISRAAITQASRASTELPISYRVASAAEPLPAADGSQTLALDMMSSHFLDHAGRERLRDEIFRVLAPGGYLFMKTFLRDGDKHTERLLTEHPGGEPGSYRHPVLKVDEHAYCEEELLSFLRERFSVSKVYRSHKHTFRGQARKRRTIALYVEKDLRA